MARLINVGSIKYSAVNDRGLTVVDDADPGADCSYALKQPAPRACLISRLGFCFFSIIG